MIRDLETLQALDTENVVEFKEAGRKTRQVRLCSQIRTTTEGTDESGQAGGKEEYARTYPAA